MHVSTYSALVYYVAIVILCRLAFIAYKFKTIVFFLYGMIKGIKHVGQQEELLCYQNSTFKIGDEYLVVLLI